MIDKEKLKSKISIIINRRLNLLNGDWFELEEETNGLTNEVVDTFLDLTRGKPKPKFKVGDIIRKKDDTPNKVQISSMDDGYYYAGSYTILIGLQDEWELEDNNKED